MWRGSQAGAVIGGAKLWYDRGKQRFFLLVSLTLETPDPTPEQALQVLGVDVGQRYLATVATLDNGAQFFLGKEIRSKADHYARLQKRLQRKGTWLCHPAQNRAGPERRDGGPLNTNHTLAKRILDTHPHACIGLEELSGMRDRTRRKHGKKATKKQRRANGHASKWAEASLHGPLTFALGNDALVRPVLPAFDISRRSRFRPGAAAGRVVIGGNFGGAHAGAHWQRNCDNKQKPCNLHCWSPLKFCATWSWRSAAKLASAQTLDVHASNRSRKSGGRSTVIGAQVSYPANRE